MTPSTRDPATCDLRLPTNDSVSELARAVLYEGYILWPYRRSALKNQQRWTFGGVYPPAWSRGAGTNDPETVAATVLVEGSGEATVEARVRFLHVVERGLVRHTLAGDVDADEVTVAGERHLAWEEAAEREIATEPVALGALTDTREWPVQVDVGEAREPLVERDGTRPAAIVRRWRALDGALSLSAERVSDGVHRLTVRVRNATSFAGEARADALRATFVSTHVVLRTSGAFVSSQDPPAALRALTATCAAEGLWPVLVGEDGARDTMLCSPIILSDYPRLAPESPGDLFDGGEIDGLLVLNILSLTDEEQAEMRDTDPRAREILDRCKSLTPDQLLKLHGVVRELR